jgi:hypothetical protein
MTKRPVLVSALSPIYVPVPEPDVNIDYARPAGENPEEQRSWADNGMQNVDSISAVLGSSLTLTKANLQQESDAVVRTEVGSLLTDELNHLESRDASYGAEICSAIKGVYSFVRNLDDLNQVVSYLNNLASSYPSYGQPSGDLVTVIQDATTQYQNAFGSCVDQLNPSVTKWILQVISNLFCPSA